MTFKFGRHQPLLIELLLLQSKKGLCCHIHSSCLDPIADWVSLNPQKKIQKKKKKKTTNMS